MNKRLLLYCSWSLCFGLLQDKNTRPFLDRSTCRWVGTEAPHLQWSFHPSFLPQTCA